LKGGLKVEEKLYKKGQNDIFSGAVICVFSAWYFVMSTRIKIMAMLAATRLNASSIPKLWGALLFILGVILLMRGFSEISKAKKEGYIPQKSTAAETFNAFLRANSQVILMFVSLFVFIALISPIGFLPACFLFLVAEFNILQRKEDRKLVPSIILALAASLIIYVLFKYAFQMPLPSGILQGIF
jgi:putative tricarboxylic transport membrane protein